MGGSDFGFAFGDAARFRVSIFKQRGNIGMVLAADSERHADVRAAGHSRKDCRTVHASARGLFLVTGPTGSGKSTTLASMINYINETVDHHIITIEDPIEFYHYHKKSTVNQREVGNDVPSFAEAIRRALRQDPDVILVGELRDLETIEAAITAAETGPRGVSARCTPTALRAPSTESSTSFPRTSRIRFAPSCRPPSLACWLKRLCPKIGGGRCAAYELLVVTPGIANLIRENKTYRITSAIQTGANTACA